MVAHGGLTPRRPPGVPMLTLAGAVVLVLLVVYAVARRADVRLVLTLVLGMPAIQPQRIRLGNVSGVIRCQWQASEPHGRAASAELFANF
jgi:hypothetical protein